MLIILYCSVRVLLVQENMGPPTPTEPLRSRCGPTEPLRSPCGPTETLPYNLMPIQSLADLGLHDLERITDQQIEAVYLAFTLDVVQDHPLLSQLLRLPVDT